MGKVEFHPVTRRLIELEAHNQELQRQVDLQQIVLAWLLSQCPGDTGLQFLSAQANEFDQPDHRERFASEIALLDELRALVASRL